MNEALAVIEYSVNEAAIAKMSDLYMDLTIDGIDDKEGWEQVHTADMVMVKHRTGIEKLRKSSNADAQTFIKNNNGEAKVLIDAMAPIESHLKSQKKAVTDEQARIKAEVDKAEQERIQGRIDALAELGITIPYFELASMDDDEFNETLESANKAHEAELARIAEEARLKTEAEEKERQEREAESQRLADERAELEALRAEQTERDRIAQEKTDKIAAEQKAAQDRIDAERKALDDAKAEAAEQARRDKNNRLFTRMNEFSKVVANVDAGIVAEWTDEEYLAALKESTESYKKWMAEQDAAMKADAEKEAAEKVEREAAEKVEADRLAAEEAARSEVLKPDKEKLIAWAFSLAAVPCPDLSSEVAENRLDSANEQLASVIEFILESAEDL